MSSPRRREPSNPTVVNSGGGFTAVGYNILTGGTPMPVNIVAGVITGANPSDGTLTQLGTLWSLKNLAVLDSAGNRGTIGYVAGGGTPLPVNIVAGVLTGANPSDGTLTQLGTLYGLAHGTLDMVSAGTLDLVSKIGTVYAGSICVTSGTVAANPTMGTLNEVYKIGTVYAGSICVTSGTVAANPTMGTLNEVYKIGTLYAGSTCITSGTVEASGTLVLGSGTLQNIGTVYMVQHGTLDMLEAGTISMLNAGTVNVPMGTLNNVYTLGTMYAGSVCVTSGTLGVSAGTVSLSGSGTVNVSMGTIIPAGLGTIKISDGTLGINMGTLNSVGSASVYSKHDLHVYDWVGTVCTGQGTIVQTANKIVKVHHYKAQADGTYGFHFAEVKPNGGTVDQGWYFLQREGVTTPFVPYPAYLFKTSTAGSGLCIGTWPSVPCNGTLRLNMIYTDDDTS